MSDDILRRYLRNKYPDADEQYIEQQAVRLQVAARAHAEQGGKTCGVCGERKPLAEYGSDASRPDGLRTVCRQCRNT